MFEHAKERFDVFIFNFNFSYSLNYIKEKDYINKLINRFHYKFLNTKNKMKEIRNFSLHYIDTKTK